MRYQNLTDLLQTAAASVIGSGTYTHAGKLDYSLSSGYAPFPHLNTFLPTSRKQQGNPAVRTFRVLLLAVAQEPSDASPVQKAAILAEMDGLLQRFYKALEENEFIELSGQNDEPQPRSYAGGVSGYAAEFLITGHLAEC